MQATIRCYEELPQVGLGTVAVLVFLCAVGAGAEENIKNPPAQQTAMPQVQAGASATQETAPQGVKPDIYAGPDSSLEPLVPRETQGDEGYVEIKPGLKAKILLGFWGPYGERPGKPLKSVVFNTNTWYAISIDFKDADDFQDNVRFKMVHQLPAAPLTWEGYEKVREMFPKADAYLENSDSTLVFTDTIEFEPGYAMSSTRYKGAIWFFLSYPPPVFRFAEGDPLGVSEFLIFFDDKLVARFPFEVLPPNPDAPPATGTPAEQMAPAGNESKQVPQDVKD